MSARVEMAAAAVAQVEVEEAAARGPLEVAKTEAGKVRARLDALRGEREAIRVRRAAGDTREEDRGRVELILLDTESLTEMLAGAEAQVATARHAHKDASARLEAAEVELAASSAYAEVEALQAHVISLARLLGEALEQLHVAGGGLHHRADLEQAQAGAIAIADVVDPVLLGLMTNIGALGERFGAHRIAWAPTEELASEVRKAELARAWIPGRPA